MKGIDNRDIGRQNVSDADFVRKKFIAAAMRAKRWNIVVYECFRAAELLVKGIMNLNGHKPPETHDLSTCLRHWLPYANRKPLFDLPYVVFRSDKLWYGLTKNAHGQMELMKRMPFGYSSLAACPDNLSIEDWLQLRLEIKERLVTVRLRKKIILQTVDYSIEFPRPQRSKGIKRVRPSPGPVANLIGAAKSLLQDRERSFFGTKRYNRAKAFSALAQLNLIRSSAYAILHGE